MFSVQAELRALVAKLTAEQVPYALCGALALAVYGYPRATLDIDLLALANSRDRIRQCARLCGFTLQAADMTFAGGAVVITRLSKAAAGEEDVPMLDVLSLSPELEAEMTVETADWHGIALQTLSRASLARLKRLRGSAQDLADLENLR